MQSFALHNNILNNFQKVIKRRNIDWKKKTTRWTLACFTFAKNIAIVFALRETSAGLE